MLLTATSALDKQRIEDEPLEVKNELGYACAYATTTLREAEERAVREAAMERAVKHRDEELERMDKVKMDAERQLRTAFTSMQWVGIVAGVAQAPRAVQEAAKVWLRAYAVIEEINAERKQRVAEAQGRAIGA